MRATKQHTCSEIHLGCWNTAGRTVIEQRDGNADGPALRLKIQRRRRRRSGRGVHRKLVRKLVRKLSRGAKPFGESRRSSLTPGCLKDVRDSRRLRDERLADRLLILNHTSVGGRLRNWVTMLTGRLVRLWEQDEVLLRKRQIQGLLWQWLRGWCRQARRTGGKPW